jgi:hypothetical protein
VVRAGSTTLQCFGGEVLGLFFRGDTSDISYRLMDFHGQGVQDPEDRCPGSGGLSSLHRTKYLRPIAVASSMDNGSWKYQLKQRRKDWKQNEKVLF